MEEAERWLADWHERHPGATSRAIARGQPSSYERLAGAARPGDRALDLACGDGFLIERLRARGAASVAGVDMSAGELAAARRRLGEDVELVQARAQSLPFPDGSFDVVTCHLALMLMSPVGEVLSEVRRVLREGGRFSAVVGTSRPPERDDAWARLSKHFAQIEFKGPAIGDSRTLSEEGLRELAAGFSEIRIEPLLVDLSGTADEVWALFVDMYLHDMMTPEAQRRLEEAARADWRDLERPDGTLPCALGWLVVTAVR